MAKKQIPPKKLVRFDWFIKHLLRDKADFEILEGFLSELLKEDIKILELIESESNKGDKIDKFNRVDVLVKTADDERMIIEIQNTKELDYLQRVLYGTSKVITENIIEGEAYINIKRVISISVVYFSLGQGDDYVYVGYTNFTGIHKNDILKLSQEQLDYFDNKIHLVEEIFPIYYLIRAQDFKEEVKDALDEWIYFFKKGEVKGLIKAKGLDKAKKRLEIANLPDLEQRQYKAYIEGLRDEASYTQQIKFEARQMAEEMAQEIAEGMAQEMAEGMAQEMAEGMAQEIAEGMAQEIVENKMTAVAKSLLIAGTDTTLVAQATGLSIDQITHIKDQITRDE